MVVTTKPNAKMNMRAMGRYSAKFGFSIVFQAVQISFFIG